LKTEEFKEKSTNIMKEHLQHSSGNMEYLKNGFEFCNTVKTINEALEILHTIKNPGPEIPSR